MRMRVGLVIMFFLLTMGLSGCAPQLIPGAWRTARGDSTNPRGLENSFPKATRLGVCRSLFPCYVFLHMLYLYVVACYSIWYYLSCFIHFLSYTFGCIHRNKCSTVGARTPMKFHVSFLFILSR